MKKITSLIFLSLVATSSFAAVKFGSVPQLPSNGKDYIGKVVAAIYRVEPGASQMISIVTKADSTLNENNLINGGTIEFTDKDSKMGMLVAANLGKNIAVTFDANYNISTVSIITDEYWNGSN